jgi:peptidoglycan/LPS O-acetylase OafA/YrhL
MSIAPHSGYIRGFDGLRAISIGLVLLTHYGAYSLLPHVPFIHERAWQLVSGTTGVNIFFTLSGFLITRILLAEKARTGGIRIKRFYIRRFLRLSPPFLLFMLLLLTGMALGLYHVRPVGVLVSFCYLYNFIPEFVKNGQLSHTWSLAVEEQFYLLWPFLLAASTRRRAVVVPTIVICLALAAAFLLPSVTFIHNGHIYRLAQIFSVHRWFLPAAGPIMVGALASVVERHGTVASEFAGGWSALAVAPLLFCAPLWLPGPLLPASFLIQASGIALLLLWMLDHQGAQMVKCLEWNPLAYIGKISYGIYIYHVLLISTGPKNALVGSPLLSLPLIAALSIASYEWMERPILHLKEKFH